MGNGLDTLGGHTWVGKDEGEMHLAIGIFSSQVRHSSVGLLGGLSEDVDLVHGTFQIWTCKDMSAGEREERKKLELIFPAAPGLSQFEGWSHPTPAVCPITDGR